jgi:hypothetical protein
MHAPSDSNVPEESVLYRALAQLARLTSTRSVLSHAPSARLRLAVKQRMRESIRSSSNTRAAFASPDCRTLELTLAVSSGHQRGLELVDSAILQVTLA